MSATRVQAVQLSVLDASTINALTFTAINPTGLSHSCFLLRIINASTTPVLISYNNGTNQHDYVGASTTSASVLQLPAQSNARNGVVGNFAKGLIVSVAGTAGVGNIYLSGYYINQEV